MHGLLVFTCMISIAFAGTLPGGYNYQQPAPSFSVSASSILPQQQQQQQQQQQHHYHNSNTANKPTIYSKQFFIHSAPEENENPENFLPKNSASIKKNLRVLLIKSPENNGLTDATLALANQEKESHTVVYVLNKQTDVAELQDKLEKLNEVEPNKPVVYFIKYRTPQEAELATNSIQSKYDSLSGTSQVTDEGEAPVISFVGSGSDQSNQGNSNSGGNANISGGSSGSVNGGFSNQLNGGSSASNSAQQIISQSPSITNSYLPANLQ